MRIHSLVMTGIGPFAGRQSVDFDAVSGDGIFLLRGQTGAGKSTVLSAVTFALYGVPADGNTRLVSDHKAADLVPRVELEFSVGGKRYRIERIPAWRRPKKRGVGTTLERSSAALFVEKGGQWSSVSDHPQELGIELGRIIGLTRDQFTQTMLLQQGRFAAFLNAKDEDRRRVLTQIFGAAPFERIERALKAQAERALLSLQAERTRLEAAMAYLRADVTREREFTQTARTAVSDTGLTEFDPESVEDRSHALTRSALIAEQASRTVGAAERAVADIEAQCGVLEGELQRALLSRKAFAAANAFVESGPAAESAAAALERHAAADSPLTARRQVEIQQSRCDHLDSEAQRGARAVEQLLRERMEWVRESALEPGPNRVDWKSNAEDLLRALRTLPRLEAAVTTAKSEVSETSRAVEFAELAEADARKEAEHVHSRRDATAEDKGRLSEASQHRDRAREVLEAVCRRDEQVGLALAHEVALGHALREEAMGTRELATLRSRFAAQVAPRLAEQLEEGQACLVCGSTVHPLPATHSDGAERITEDDVNDAEQRLADATSAVASAKQALALTEERLAQAAEAAGGVEAEAARRDLSMAEAAVETALNAQTRYEQLTGECAAADAAVAQAVDALQQARINQARAVQSFESAQEAFIREQKMAEGHRSDLVGGDEGNAVTLEAEHVALALTWLANLETAEAELSRTLALREQAAANLSEAESALAEALRASPFGTWREAQDARLDDETVATSQSEVARGSRTRQDLERVCEELADSTPAEFMTGASSAGVSTSDVQAPGARTAESHTVASHTAEFQGVGSGTAEATRSLAARVRDASRRMLDAGLALLGGIDEDAADWQQCGALIESVVQDVDVALAERREEKDEGRRRLTEATAKSALAVQWRSSLEARVREVEQIVEVLGEEDQHAQMLKRLADTAVGNGEDNERRMSLQFFVLASRLEEIAAAATSRLLPMSGGRFRIFHDDEKFGNQKSGLGLKIEDLWTGGFRSPATLSGGESFMASLCLALGLADVVTAEAGGITMETLFVDEGFGSLDRNTLDTVMGELDKLREGGRTVGIVSHVNELVERIPRQIVVSKTSAGSSLAVVAG